MPLPEMYNKEDQWLEGPFFFFFFKKKKHAIVCVPSRGFAGLST